MKRRFSGTQLLLLATLLRAVASFATSAGSFLSEDGQRSVDTRHEIRHHLAEVPGTGGSEAVTYFDRQWHAVNRSRLWHAGTAMILGAVCVWGLIRSRKGLERQPTSRLSGPA